MNAHDKWTIGIDLGGTKIVAALVSEAGKVSSRLRRATHVDGGAEAIVEHLAGMIEELRAGHDELSVEGVGIGVAGQVDEADGSVRFAPNLGWHDVPLQAQLEERLHIPITVTNDVRAATWGEWLHGAGIGCDDFVCLFVGTGVGGGVVSGGRLLSGCSNTAGELGHITVEFNGPACRCKNRGCLEALASGWAIAQRAQEAIADDPDAAKALLKLARNKVANVTGRTVTQAYREHDPLACKIIEGVSHALGAGAVSLINAFNPQRFILGGGVIGALPELVSQVDQYVRKRALQAALDPLKVMPAKLKDDAGCIGAAALVHRASEGKGVASCVSA